MVVDEWRRKSGGGRVAADERPPVADGWQQTSGGGRVAADEYWAGTVLALMLVLYWYWTSTIPGTGTVQVLNRYRALLHVLELVLVVELVQGQVRILVQVCRDGGGWGGMFGVASHVDPFLIFTTELIGLLIYNYICIFHRHAAFATTNPVDHIPRHRGEKEKTIRLEHGHTAVATDRARAET